jgi:hypothetical protein
MDDYSAVDTADLPGVSPTKPGHNDLVPDRYIYKVVDYLPGAALVDVLLDWLDGKANVKFFSEDYPRHGMPAGDLTPPPIFRVGGGVRIRLCSSGF